MHPMGHRLAVFAVIGDVDPRRTLQPHDLGHRTPEGRLKGSLVAGPSLVAVAVGGDQRLGPWQAPDMAGNDSIGADLHRGLPRLIGADPSSALVSAGRVPSLLPRQRGKSWR